jgi:hypothetical protein
MCPNKQLLILEDQIFTDQKKQGESKIEKKQRTYFSEIFL